MQDLTLKISFHFPYRLLADLVLFELENGIICPLASLEDIEAMKAISIAQRGSAKDFVDLYYLFQKTQHTFKDVSDGVQRKYQLEKKYDYHLKAAMVYFDDSEKEINDILQVDHSEKIRKTTQEEWVEIEQFFLRFCV